MGQSWTLENVVATARENPRSFFIPSEQDRTSRKAGDSVRLHFVLIDPGPDEPRAERMWVDIISERDTPPMYVGILDNQPRYIKGLNLGDHVPFGPEHIAQTLVRPSDPAWFEAAEKGALVSKAVFDPGQCVRWMYRETPDRPKDSGWRLFAGTEDDAYANDTSNIRICNIGWLTDLDATLLPAIKAEVGAAFERASANDPWVAVENWSPEED
jgi:hypothetical protein